MLFKYSTLSPTKGLLLDNQVFTRFVENEHSFMLII